VQVTVDLWDFPQMTDIIVLHWGDTFRGARGRIAR